MHKHIKRDDRICIALMLKQGHTYTEIAKELNFHRTTILREIKRNNCNGIYRVAKANKLSKERNLRIITYVDRFSGYLIAGYSTAKADDIHLHAKNNFKSKPCLTITYDNGSEFALHQMIERDTSALVYFADKGKPQQRGANENINGLLRQYFPKGSSFATITNRDVQRAVRKLNNRPRKRLNYLTPRQVFSSAFQELI